MAANLAFDNPQGSFFRLEPDMMKQGLQASKESPRLRMILPIHRKQEAEVQRLINFLQPGTYIRPHKHPLPHATESIVLLSGSIRFFTFNDHGSILTDHLLKHSEAPQIIDIEPGTWHSFLVVEPDTILFECKKGPYNAKTDKEFAGWAPEEGSESVHRWMKSLSQ
jgi:cupin fold WbuC family metalloprotein